MNRKTISTIVFSFVMVVAILAIQTLSASNLTDASAMAPAVADVTATPTSSSTGACSVDDAYCLEQLYTGLQSLVEYQEKKVKYAHDMIKDTEDLIAQLEDQGQDTWELRDALEAYGWTVSEAEESHRLAKELLTIHEGFDNYGNITVLFYAKETVVNCKEAWLNAQQKFNSANLSLSAATWKFRVYSE